MHVVDIMTVNSTGKISSELKVVMQKVAAIFLQERKKSVLMSFNHPLGDGILACKGDKILWGIPGTLFYADLGTDCGERRTFEFFFPRGAEEFVLEDSMIAIDFFETPEGFEFSPINMERAYIDRAAIKAETMQ